MDKYLERAKKEIVNHPKLTVQELADVFRFADVNNDNTISAIRADIARSEKKFSNNIKKLDDYISSI